MGRGVRKDAVKICGPGDGKGAVAGEGPSHVGGVSAGGVKTVVASGVAVELAPGVAGEATVPDVGDSVVISADPGGEVAAPDASLDPCVAWVAGAKRCWPR